MKNHYSILIRTCWIVLVCCFLVKIFGGNYFEIAVQNEKFIHACEFVDENIWLKMFLGLVFYCFSTYLYLCIVLKEKLLSRKHICMFLPLMVIKVVLSWYYPIIAFVLDFIIAVFIPLFINKNIKYTIICLLFLWSFQIISLLIKNFGIHDFNINIFLIQSIYQIDYYIMMILYYLYTFKNKKED